MITPTMPGRALRLRIFQNDWRDINVKLLITNLFASQFRRSQAVIDAKWGAIKY